jgi:outer membrane lipoprotein-sorting protein
MTTLLAVLLLTVSADPTFKDLIQTNLKDLSMKATVAEKNLGELRKIGRDFYLAYRFSEMTVLYKSPSKMRLESQYQNARAIYILSGAKKYILIPSLNHKSTDELAEQPGKRQSMLDFGLIDKGVAEFMKGEYVRTDRETGQWVFDLRYQYYDDTSRHRVWVDPKTKVIMKREWFGQTGNLKATFYYKDVKEVAKGIFMPTRAEVRNVEGKKAGETVNQDIRANTGDVSDSSFVP